MGVPGSIHHAVTGSADRSRGSRGIRRSPPPVSRDGGGWSCSVDAEGSVLGVNMVSVRVHVEEEGGRERHGGGGRCWRGVCMRREVSGPSSAGHPAGPVITSFTSV